MAEYITHSREETVALGRKLAAVLPDGALIAFTGGLGAITTFTAMFYAAISGSDDQHAFVAARIRSNTCKFAVIGSDYAGR